MTKLDIFNIALAEFGEPQVTDVDLEQQQDKSVKVLMQNYQIALDKASRESEWSWLEDIIELEEPIARNVGEFAYVYKLPEDVLQIISVEPEMTYRVIGTKIYCEEIADFAYAKLNSLLDESNFHAILLGLNANCFLLCDTDAPAPAPCFRTAR